MKRLNIIFFVVVLGLSIYYVGNNLALNNDVIRVFTSNISDSPGKNRELIDKVFKSVISDEESPITIIRNFKKSNNSLKKVSSINNLSGKPLVYIYNTHQSEAYQMTAYNISPTTFTASHMLSDELKALGILSIVEEKDIMKELNKRGLPYEGTYDISRECFIASKNKNKSLKYFFDVHRDSLARDLSVAKINGKSYAKMMFLVGKKNPNYKKNLVYIKKMEAYINKNYKGLLRETYYKNYIYNQDLSNRAFLIELGGQHNTLEEVYNSVKVLAEVIYQLEMGEI